MTILVSYEGVLVSPKNIPIPTGEELYRAFSDKNRLVVSTSGRAESASRQLALRNLTGHAEVVGIEQEMAGVPLVVRHLEYQQLLGNVSLVITPDPDVARVCIKRGVAVAVFVDSSFSDPRNFPGSEPVIESWESISRTIEKRRLHGRDVESDAIDL